MQMSLLWAIDWRGFQDIAEIGQIRGATGEHYEFAGPAVAKPTCGT